MARWVLLVLLLILSACAPRPGVKATTPVLLVPGGLIIGRWVELQGSRFALPSPPLAADAAGRTLYAAYPYRLLIFEDGRLLASEALPFVPTFVHARPTLVTGGTEGVWIQGGATWRVRAQDARYREMLYWIGDGAAYAGRRRLDLRHPRQVVADDEHVAFLGDEARFVAGARFPLPTFKDADLFGDLYLLTADAVLRFSSGGLLLDRRAGHYDAVRVDARGVWLRAGERLVHLGLDLEETP